MVYIYPSDGIGGMELNQQQVVEFALTFPDVVADHPFDDGSTVLRCRGNRKWFALLLEVRGVPSVNLKCDPMRADLYRRVYRSVTPGWHMNKTHWNTVALQGDVPDDELQAMIAHSYALVHGGSLRY